MITKILQETPYPVYDYELVFRPTENLRRRLDLVRKAMQQKAPTAFYNLGRNHLLLASFSQYAMMEEKMVQRLRRMAMSMPPFKMSLENFGAFAPHTIYFAFQPSPGFDRLQAMLRAEKHLMKVINQEPRIAGMPKIVVAQKLNISLFDLWWNSFERKKFHASMLVDSMLLLRRRQGERHWQILDRFEFNNLPAEVHQGTLFS
jgi:2'-5' RNA ligase